MKKYLTVANVLEIHHYLINEFGGTHGLRDKQALESAINRPQSGYYKTILEEATALMESLFINHPFIDGNKRIAFFCTDIFLRLNGYSIECDDEIAYKYFMNLFDENKLNFDNLLSWLRENTVNQ
jgi:death-on-curing protein